MGLKEFAVKTEKGNLLFSLEARIDELVGQLKMIKNDLVTLKNEASSNPMYTSEDEEEIQAVIDNLTEKVEKAFLEKSE